MRDRNVIESAVMRILCSSTVLPISLTTSMLVAINFSLSFADKGCPVQSVKSPSKVVKRRDMDMYSKTKLRILV